MIQWPLSHYEHFHQKKAATMGEKMIDNLELAIGSPPFFVLSLKYYIKKFFICAKLKIL